MSSTTETLTLFDIAEQVERVCICGCGKSLAGAHGNRRVREECEKEWDKKRRDVKRKKLLQEKRTKAEEKFLEFHRRNPHIYDAILEKTLQLFKAGRKHYSIKAVYEFVRLEEIIKINGGKSNMNNNYTAYYARMVMDNVPQLEGFFQTRDREV